MGGHVERLTELQNAWHEGPGRAQVAVSMVLALACELDVGRGTPDISAPDIPTRLRAVIEEAMNGPAPVLVPTTTTAPPALLATTRFPAPDGCICKHPDGWSNPVGHGATCQIQHGYPNAEA